jgi:hypothetical protein
MPNKSSKMVTVTLPEVDTVYVAALKASCRHFRITHDRIAATAKVTRPMVVNVFAGRKRSRNVIETAQRLVARAERRQRRA